MKKSTKTQIRDAKRSGWNAGKDTGKYRVDRQSETTIMRVRI